MTHQVALTFSARVRPGRREALEELLCSMAEDPGGNRVIPFAQLPQTHFARVLLLEPGPEEDDPTLIVTLDCDATVGERLDDLVQVAGAGLDELFGGCAD